MASRMERYSNNQRKSRTGRNQKLYNSIYSYGKYSNIEGIAQIDNSNEIDITKVKEMINNREKYQVQRKYRKATGEEVKVQEVPKYKKHLENNNRTYDIMDVLNKAKENKKPDDKERVLNKESIDVLKNLNIKKNVKDYNDDEDLKDMIKTITHTSMLNKMDDEDLAADMFSDLQARNDDTKIKDIKDVKELIKEAEDKKK